MSGKLYLVGTPIGNLGDFSPRARSVLEEVDFIAAEDTRVTLKLLNRFDIHKYASSGGIQQRRIEALCALLGGESCALVTDAGMPAISDPGEDMVRLCAENGIEVMSVPGPVAVCTALALSALPTGRFCFEGFLSTSNKSRREHLESLVNERRTMVFYEAPHKLLRTLEDMRSTFGGTRRISLCRELTKVHEETLRTDLDGAVRHFSETPPKGEFVLVIEGASEEKKEISIEEALRIAESYRSEGLSRKAAAKKAAAETGFGSKELYDASLNEENTIL